MALTKEQRAEILKKARAAKKKVKPTLEAAQPEIAELKASDTPVNDTPKRAASTPWKPAKVLDIPESYKDPRFTYRWCTKDKPGNITKKLQEGWEIDNALSAKLTAQYGLKKTLQDGSPLDSTVQVREMVVMRMPKEMADQRNDYYQKRTQIGTRSTQSAFQQQLAESGGSGARIYGSYEESQTG